MEMHKSSWNPDVGVAIAYPYIISKDYYKAPFFGTEFEFESDLARAIENLRAMFQVMIDKEGEKEQRFIDTFLASIKKNDPSFYSEVVTFFENVDDKSKMIDMIQKYRMGLLKNYETIEVGLREFDKKWDLFYNKTFLNALYQLKIDNPLDASPEQLINMIQQQMQEEADKRLKEEESKQYATFLGSTFNAIRDMSSTKFGKDYTKALQGLKDNSYIKGKIKEHAGKGKTQSIYEIFQGYLFGILNGLSSEQFLVTFGGGSSTARFTQSTSTLTGNNKSSAVAIKTDVLEIVNTDLTLEPPDQRKIIDKLESTTSKELYKYIEDIDDKTAFVIHTSVKDQSTNKNYSTGKSMAVDIAKKQDATLDTRLGPLKEIAAVVGSSQGDIESLIFGIANAGNYMIDYGMKNAIVIGITSLCAAYMFEDYVDTFSQFDSETTNKHLHLYFANGKYYTVSDILRLSLSSLTSAGKNQYVKVSFGPTTANEFKASDVSDLSGQDKWNAVRTNTLKHGKLGIKLDTNALLNAIYPA